MRIVPIILLFLLSLTTCSRVETISTAGVQPVASTPAPSIGKENTNIQDSQLKQVLPAIRLTTKQRKYLDESLPTDVRRILERSERFEILAEVDKDESSEQDSREFHPNRIVVVRDEKQKKEILEAFYFDAASEDSPAVCYEPHHSLLASYEGKIVEVEICFSCSRFKVNGSDAWGTIVREGRKSEDLFNSIIERQGVEFSR